MLTSFVLNQNNLISNFSSPRKVIDSKKAAEYIRQQDAIADKFQRQLDINIQNFLLGTPNRKNINLVLPITNALWQLWNDSWRLGMSHAAIESKVKFHDKSDLAMFAKSEEEKRLENDIKGIDARLARIEQTQRRNDVVYSENAVRGIEERKQRLNDDRNVKLDRLIEIKQQSGNATTRSTNRNQQVATPEVNNNATKRRSPNKRIQKVITEESQRTSIPAKKASGRKKEVVEKVYDESTPRNQAYKRVQEQRIEQSTVPPLEQTTFGDIYLQKRLNAVSARTATQLNPYYQQQLRTIIPNYFSTKPPSNDATVVRAIRNMYISKQLTDGNYTQKSANLDRAINRANENEKTRSRSIGDELQEIRGQLRNRMSDQERAALIGRQKELRNEDADIDKRIVNKTISVSLTDDEAEKLGLSAGTYTTKQLLARQRTINKDIRNVDANYYNTRRIALTELGHAYNLGRLDYYDKNGVDYLKWTTSIEHQRRDVVCDICQKRDGKVYSLQEILDDYRLQPAIHPFCGCTLVADKEDDDDNKRKRRKVKAKSSDMFDNSVLAWAAGGGLAVLGTAAMYAAFKLSRIKPIQPINQTPGIAKLLPKAITAQPYIRQMSESIADTVAQNRGELLQQASLPTLSIPEVMLDVIPLGISNTTVDITPYVNAIDNATNTKRQDLHGHSYREHTNEVLQQVSVNRQRLNEDSPQSVTSNVNGRIEAIRNNIQRYQAYLRSDLSPTERRSVIKQYRNDISTLNRIIDNYETQNFKVYSEIKALMLLRDNGERSIAQNLTTVAEDEVRDIFASTDLGRRINDEMIELNSTLLARINGLTKSGFVDNLKELRGNVLSANPELTSDYLQSIKPSLVKSANNLPSIAIQPIEDSLNNLVKILQVNERITADQFQQYSEAVDEIGDIVNRINKRITSTLIDVDLPTFISSTRDRNNRASLVAEAQFLLDYKNAIKEIYNRLNSVNVILFLKWHG